MQKRTVFLLQENKNANETLEEYFKQDADFEVIGSATDGISAISSIVDKKPGYLITDILLSGYDGLSVVRKIRETSNAKIIVLTALMSDDIAVKAIDAGADYFMVKPVNFPVLKERLIELGEEKKNSAQKQRMEMDEMLHVISLEEKISKIFINVGIPPHIKGYAFLREGVKMAVDEPTIINNITKKLYPSIGEKFNTTASKVERAIRHAIEVAWNRGRIETINSILGVRAYVGQEKPTNGEFIALVADKMMLEKK